MKKNQISLIGSVILFPLRSHYDGFDPASTLLEIKLILNCHLFSMQIEIYGFIDTEQRIIINDGIILRQTNRHIQLTLLCITIYYLLSL